MRSFLFGLLFFVALAGCGKSPVPSGSWIIVQSYGDCPEEGWKDIGVLNEQPGFNARSWVVELDNGAYLDAGLFRVCEKM